MSWQELELADLCLKIGSGSTPRGGSKSYKQSGITLIRSMNVHMGFFKRQNLAFIDADQAERLDHVALEADDVLLNITGASVARCCALDNSLLPARVNQHVCILRPNQEKLDSEYLMRYLTSADAQKKLLRIACAGATREAITKSEILKFRLPLPPLAEQKKIAAILDAADQLRQKDQQLIDHYITLSQSLFLEMFGDPVSNLKGWGLVSLGALCEFENGDRSSNYPSKSEVLNSGKLFLSSADIGKGYFEVKSSKFISKEKFNSLSRGKCRRGDVLMTLRGNGLGRSCVFECEYDEGFINAQMVILRPDSSVCTARFLVAQLNNEMVFSQLLKHTSGSAQPQFSATDVKRFKVLVPPIALQNKFVEHTDAIQNQKEQVRLTQEKSDSLFNSLLQKAFKGELTSSKAA